MDGRLVCAQSDGLVAGACVTGSSCLASIVLSTLLIITQNYVVDSQELVGTFRKPCSTT